MVGRAEPRVTGGVRHPRPVRVVAGDAEAEIDRRIGHPPRQPDIVVDPGTAGLVEGVRVVGRVRRVPGVPFELLGIRFSYNFV